MLVQVKPALKVLDMTTVSVSLDKRLTLDHADIKDISIPPTAEELIATAEPYLPVNLVGAKHHLAADSVDKM